MCQLCQAKERVYLRRGQILEVSIATPITRCPRLICTRKRTPDDSDRVKQLERQVAALQAHITVLEEAQSVSTSKLAPWPKDTSHDFVDAQSDLHTDLDSHDELDHDDVYGGNSDVQLDQAERLPVDDLSDMMWKLSVSGPGGVSFQGPSGNFCFPQSPAASSKKPQIPHVDMLPDLTDELAARQLLLGLFEERVNSFHFLCDGTPDTTVLMNSSDSATMPEQFLTASTIAAGSVFTKELSLKKLGQIYLEYAESIALTCCRLHPSTTILRSLTVLSWIYLSRGDGDVGYMYNCKLSMPPIQSRLTIQCRYGWSYDTAARATCK